MTDKRERSFTHLRSKCAVLKPVRAVVCAFLFVFLWSAGVAHAADDPGIVIDLRFDQPLGTIYSGQNSGERTGITYEAADLDASGRDELLIGVPLTKDQRGRLDIYFDPFISGATDAVAATDLSAATSPKRITINGLVKEDWFGYAVTSGDMNGDGRVDIAASAVNAELPKRPLAGSVYLFFGGNPALTDDSHDWQASDADVIFVGASKLDGIGAEMTVGDFDQDGLDDLVMTAPFGDTEFDKRYTNRVYIYHGDTLAARIAGAATPVIVDMFDEADVILTNVIYKENAGVNSSGLLVADYLGGDGVDDLIIGSARGGNHKGIVYIVPGGDRPAGEYNIDTEAHMILRGESSGAFGSALAVGDFDNNGFIDLAIGARQARGEEKRGGTVSILFATGTVAPAPTPYEFILNEERTSPYFEEYVISAARSSEYFGVSLASADFNQDGVTDLAVGATSGRRADDEGRDSGRVYVFSGRSRAAWGDLYETEERGDHVFITGRRKEDELGIALTTGNFDDPVRPCLVAGAWQADGVDNKSSKSGETYIFGEAMGARLAAHAVFPPSPLAEKAGPIVHDLWSWAQTWGKLTKNVPPGFDIDRSGQVDEGDLRLLKMRRKLDNRLDLLPHPVAEE